MSILIEPYLFILPLLDRLGCGGIVLATDGEVMAINQSAGRIVGSELDLAPQQVVDLPSTGREVLKRLLRRTNKRFRIDGGSWAVIPRQGRRPLVLDTLLLPAGASGRAHTALILIDFDEDLQANENALSRIFSLTPAEANLARLLHLGLSPPQIAEALAVRISTVRSHLASIYRKTAVSGQVDLVALMSRLSVLGASE